MEPDFCPACGRPRRPGVSFCTTCNYFLGQPALQPPAATQRAAGLSPELVLVLLIAAAVLVALGVLLTAPAS